MTDNEKEIVQQIAGIATASVDMVSRLVFRLTNLNKLTPDEALLVLSDLSGHHRDLASRNEKLPGMALVFRDIADRLDVHADQLQSDTGASLDKWKQTRP